MHIEYEVRRRYQQPQMFSDEYDAADEIIADEYYIEDQEVDVDESIDECYGRIEICGTEYWASRILRELDENVYEEYLDDERRNYAENNRDYVAAQIRLLDAGEEYNCEGGITVTAIEVLDEDDEEEDDFDHEEFNEVFE